MSNEIQVSLHGNRCGLNDKNQIVAQNPTTGVLYAVTPIPEAGNEIEESTLAELVGAINATTGLSVSINKNGPIVTLDFTFDEVALTYTDAAASGASASLKLFDFVQAGIQPIASRSDFDWEGDALIDGDVGDLAFIYAFGSAAANAGDGALTGTEVDFAAVSATVTLAEHVASATTFKGAGAAIDGTTTAADLYLNVSGTAATSEANGVLSVSGTATIVCALLGDD